jgi:RNA polymerase sigma-70 factor (ECF subfamily)
MVNKLLPDEKELLIELSRNSAQAYTRLYQFYFPRLYGKLFKQLKSKADVNEILQEVFMKLWELRASIDPEKSFRSYLFRIAENKVYDFFRKSAIEKNIHRQFLKADKGQYSYIHEEIESKENDVILNYAINSLPPQRRAIFRLCKLEEKSYKDVSEKLGISTSTISDHIVKAKSYLKKYLSIQHGSLTSAIPVFLNVKLK